MAGCRPEYMPVVVAAVRGLCHPDFAYHGPASSTGGSAMVLVVNGPIARAARHQRRQQRVRPGPPPQRDDRPRGAPHHDERDEHAPRPARPRHARQPGQVRLLLRRARGRSPVGAAARRARPAAATTARSRSIASNSLYQVYNQLAAEPEPLLLCFADALGNWARPTCKGFNQSLIVLRRRARRGAARRRLEPAPRPASSSSSTRAGRWPTSSARARLPGDGARRPTRRRGATRVRAARGHPHRVRRRPGGELVGLPAGLGQEVDAQRHDARRGPDEETHEDLRSDLEAGGARDRSWRPRPGEPAGACASAWWRTPSSTPSPCSRSWPTGWRARHGMTVTVHEPQALAQPRGRRGRASRRCARRPTSSSPASATEGRAARAVCSTRS